MLKWLAGKKTYILAIAVAVLLAGLVGAGQLTPELAIDILVFAAPCFAATFRDAIQKNHSQVLAVLEEIAQTGADLRLHKPDVLAVDAATLVKLAGPILVPGPQGPAGLSGPQGPAGPVGILSGGYPGAPKAGS